MSCDDAGCRVNGVHRGDNVDFTYNFVNKIDVSRFHKIYIHCVHYCIYSSVSHVFLPHGSDLSTVVPAP